LWADYLRPVDLQNGHLGRFLSVNLPQPAEVYCKQDQQKQPYGNAQGYTAAPINGLGSMTRLCHAANVAPRWRPLQGSSEFGSAGIRLFTESWLSAPGRRPTSQDVSCRGRRCIFFCDCQDVETAAEINAQITDSGPAVADRRRQSQETLKGFDDQLLNKSIAAFVEGSKKLK
jgi:hypothetical protein